MYQFTLVATFDSKTEAKCALEDAEEAVGRHNGEVEDSDVEKVEE